MKDNVRCKTCTFFDSNLDTAIKTADGDGFCLRSPPVILPETSFAKQASEFPMVSDTWRCGEWKKSE